MWVGLLGLGRSEKRPAWRGIVFIQIDALGKKQFERALASGRLPFLKNLIERQHYHLLTHYSGVPSSTAAVQAELFYGLKSAVPAFRFYDHRSRRIFTMFNPADALEIERRLQRLGRPLLAGGSAYADIYTGGADEPHFCISQLGAGWTCRGGRPFAFMLLFVLHFYSLVRTMALLWVELVLAVVDFFRGLVRGRDLWKELKFVPSRVAMCVLLRELTVIGAKIDVSRGMPVIHVNLMGYHEQSHRRGPGSRFAHWTLKGIDQAVKRIWLAAHRAAAPEYDVWIYSDHGQIKTIPYEKKFNKDVREAVAESFEQLEFSAAEKTDRRRPGFLARAGFRRPAFLAGLFPSRQGGGPDGAIIAALGPIGHIYLGKELPPEQRRRLAVGFVRQGRIPLVFDTGKNRPGGLVEAWTDGGLLRLPEKAADVFDNAVPFFQEMVEDFLDSCRRENCGDILISGWKPNIPHCYSFAVENGSHGGTNPEEAEGFALVPRQRVMAGSQKGYVRPLDMRNCAFELLEGRREEGGNPFVQAAAEQGILRVMTYNVHGCVGMDGRLSPTRIAEVISQYQPDIAALQELDVGRSRSRRQDQARLIADYLNMEHHFHASMRLAEEAFGDAILSSYPIKLLRKAGLSREKKLSFLEHRGALWIVLDFQGTPVHIVNTHLGLNPKERLLHAEELLGSEWLGNPQCKGAVILCGDFNTLPGSRVFGLFDVVLPSVQGRTRGDRHKQTWFGRYPVACLDHIFASAAFEVVRVEVGDSHLARLASDHRPIIADLKFNLGTPY